MRSRRRSVLVVDDEQAFREALVELLGDLGYEAHEAADAQAAVQSLAYEDFDVALVDLRMPVLDGHLLLQELARRGLRVPVIAMSGTGTPEDVIALKREGAAEFLRKPFSGDDLEATLARVLDRTPPRARSSLRFTGPAPPEREPTVAVSRFRRAQPLAPVAVPGRGQKQAPPAVRDLAAEITRILDGGNYQLPAIARIANDVQRLMTEPMPRVSDIVEVVSKDPTVTVALLRTANSSMFRGGTPVTNVRTACLRLGNKRVLALAQTAIVHGLFEVPAGPLRDVLGAMWKNVVITACTARALAVRLNLDEPEDVYVAAMLHNLGELVIVRLLAGLELEDRSAPALLERTGALLASSHEQVGRRLLSEWGMQGAAIELAGAHHHPPRAPQSRVARTLRLVVFAAWMGTCRAGYTYLPGQEDPDMEPTLRQLGIEPAELDELVENAARAVDSSADTHA